MQTSGEPARPQGTACWSSAGLAVARSRTTALIETTARIQNVERRQDALGSAEYIGEGKALLVADPCPCGSGIKTKKCCPELVA